MSITIATQNKRFTAKMTETESEEMFARLVQDVLGITVLLSAESQPTQIPVKTTVTNLDTNEMPNDSDADEYSIQEPESPPELGQGYSGFLYIKCEHCGNAHAFCPKHKITSYKCSDCGAETVLKDMTPMYTHCECGKKSRYLTNMDEFAFDVSCISCGAPVAVKYNDRKRVYETIK